MTALTYQKDAKAYRFSLPNKIWGLKLPPPAFSILAYLCYLNSHHRGGAVPSVDEIAALLHMSPDMAEKQLDTLVKRNLISPQMVPVFSRKHAGKFFSLPNEIFSLDLGHGAITVYAYLLYCEDRSSHQCHPSYNTISATVGLAVNTVMKHIAKLEDRQFITVERTSYFDRQGMKWNGNNCYTILPIQAAMDYCYQQQRNCKNKAVFAPVSRCVRLCREQREQIPARPIRTDLGRLSRADGGQNKGSRRNPAKRVRWEKEEQRNERVFAHLGGSEGYGDSDDVKQDKHQASSATLCSVTSARSAGSYGVFREFQSGVKIEGVLSLLRSLSLKAYTHKKKVGVIPRKGAHFEQERKICPLSHS